MKSSIFAVAASALLATSVEARLARRNAHANAHAHFEVEARGAEEICPPKPCTTYVTGTWVEYQAPYTPPAYVYTSTSAAVVPPVSTSCITLPYAPTKPVPTPEVTTCATPGTYTIPAKTVTISTHETICVPTSTVYETPGAYTPGYSVTIVSTPTVVTCPYATIVTKAQTAYTTVATTTITCPTPGTYTYGGFPTTISTGLATCVYPVVTVYTPAVYTHPLTTVTVTETAYPVTCPYETLSSATPVYTAPAKVYTAPAKVYTAPAVVYSSPVAPEVYTTSSAYSAPTSPAKTSTSDIGGVLNQWCITYSPYNSDTSCKTSDQITSDIEDIASKGFHSVRLYSADCGALPAVSAACDTHGLKLVLGVWIEAGGLTSAYADLALIIEWGKWELVELLVVGNEAIFNGWITPTDLASFITACKTKLIAAGYTGPVTTSETLNILQANPGLCTVIDVVGVNIHPFFNSGCVAEDAGTFLMEELKIAEGVCGGKTGYVLEAGWPSAGEPNGIAVPGYSEQKTALDAIYAVDDGRITYFTYTDDLWKQPGLYDVEPHFGCADLFPLSS